MQIDIERSNGHVQSALVTGLVPEKNCVNVEWFEKVCIHLLFKKYKIDMVGILPWRIESGV